MLAPEELRALGLGEDQSQELAQKVAATSQGLEELVRTQEFVPSDARWVNFGGTRPGVVPAGSDGAQRDLYVYENVAAVVESGGQHNQLILGTLVRVGDVWRLIDLPKSLSDTQVSTASEGFFFPAIPKRGAAGDAQAVEGLSEKVRQLLGDLEQVDKDLLTAATIEATASLNARRADVLEQLAAEATSDEDRTMWLRQVADTVSACSSVGWIPAGHRTAPEALRETHRREIQCRSGGLREVPPSVGGLHPQYAETGRRFRQYPGPMDGGSGAVRPGLSHGFRYPRGVEAAGDGRGIRRT